MFFPFALTYLETVVGVIISPERLTVKVSKLPSGCGILLVKIPIFFFYVSFPTPSPNETPRECALVLGTEGVVDRQLLNPNKDYTGPTPLGFHLGGFFISFFPFPRKGRD